MESIKDKVAIIGMGCTKFGDNWTQSAEDMIIDAAYEAFDDAGIQSKDLQAAWVGTMISSMSGISLARPLKLPNIPVTRVENFCATGTEALRNAAFAVACGAYDLVLALGFEKLKDLGFNIVATGEHPVFSSGRSSPGEFAMAATRYFAIHAIPPDEGKQMLAKISVKNHHNGSLHPKAHFQREVTLEEVLRAPIIAWPLGLLDCCPRTDGAAAAIICRRQDASSYKPSGEYITIKGMGISAGAATGRIRTDYDFLHFEENLSAARQAYEQGGIKDPSTELSLAIVHDCFSINEVLTYEDLGFCPRGKSKEYIDAGDFELSGRLPVNTDGGLKSFGHPQGASGLRMIYEVYNQLLGRADRRQLKDPELGLTHNIGGSPVMGGLASVTILGRG